MKILHILDHSIPLHSGYTFRTRAILEQQRKLGWETEHITSPKHNVVATPSGDEELIEQFHFFRTLPSRSLFSKLPFLDQWSIVMQLEKRLEEIIMTVNPDILHAHSPSLNGLAAVRVGERHGIPVVYEIRAFWEDAAVDHGTTTEGSVRYRITRAMETWVINKADAVTTICEGLKKDIISRGIPEDKITVVPNAVDIEKFAFDRLPDETLRNSLGLKGVIVLGFIGSFYAYEGLPLLIQALLEIHKQYPEVKILLVGGGPQESYLKEQVKRLELEDYVVFTGRVPHSQVQSYYDLVDIFIYPRISKRITELVTPLKPLEAMAQGRLVVASDVGGHKELISHEHTGVLFKADDKSSLAESVVELIANRQRWSDLTREARKYVEIARNWETSVYNYKHVYPKLLRKET